MSKDNIIKAYASDIDRDFTRGLVYSVTMSIVSEINKFDINDLLMKETMEIKEALAEIINRTFIINISISGDTQEDRVDETIRLISDEFSCTVLELPVGFPFPIRYLISEVVLEDNKLRLHCVMLDISDNDLKDISLLRKEYVINKKDKSFKLKKMTKKIN